jgi:succinate dehydrogenase / fumarate reductase cytochrome b subunit
MSPSTQVALIALILFFAVAAVSIVWPRLTELKWSSMKLASGVRPATITLPRSAPPTVEAERQDRPLSAYFQTDRWTWTMPTVHRIAGGALGLGAILLLAFWLLSRDRAQRVFGSPLGLTILLVYTLALMQYLVLGIRRLIWDFGYGMEPEMHRDLARVTPLAAVLLTSLIWVGVQLRYGTPPSLPDGSSRTAVKPQNGMSDPVLAYESARRGYIAAQSELETLTAIMGKLADGLRADPLRVDPGLWPSRDQLAEAQRQVRAARGALRGAWASVPADLRSGLEPPPPE